MVRAARNQYDLIIVGAGMVGAATACLLARACQRDKAQPMSIALIEARPAQPFNGDQFDPRVVALTEKSRQLLEHCGVWETLAGMRISPYGAMRVWDAEGTGKIHFDSHQVGRPNLGHIVENSALVEALLGEVKALETINFYCPTKVRDYQLTADGISVELEGGERLGANLLVAADGANSTIRQHFEFATREWDYGHQAIVTTVTTEQAHQKTAWQRFMPTGPLAFLPLDDRGDLHRCSLVWSQETAVADRLIKLHEKAFCAELSVASEHCLGAVLKADKRYLIPLRQRHANDYIKERVVLLGDAAHTIHPLAGQGVNLGFADVEALVQEIGRARQRAVDIGDISVLGRYQRRRKPHNLATMAVMEGFKRLFAADNLALRLVRNRGMSGLDKLQPIKNAIIKKAMGL